MARFRSRNVRSRFFVCPLFLFCAHLPSRGVLMRGEDGEGIRELGVGERFAKGEG